MRAVTIYTFQPGFGIPLTWSPETSTRNLRGSERRANLPAGRAGDLYFKPGLPSQLARGTRAMNPSGLVCERLRQTKKRRPPLDTTFSALAADAAAAENTTSSGTTRLDLPRGKRVATCSIAKSNPERTLCVDSSIPIRRVQRLLRSPLIDNGIAPQARERLRNHCDWPP